jgi:hypothetical protein
LACCAKTGEVSVDTSTTEEAYTHVTKQGEREAAIALEGAHFGDLFPDLPNLGNGKMKEAAN